MAQDLAVRSPDSTELMITIAGGEQIPAIMVGNLISALARDYRVMHRGRTLVVSRLQTGSLLIFVQDAYQAAQPFLENSVSFSKGAKAILDFAKSLRESLSRKKDASADIGEKAGPYRSIQEIVKIAAETGASVSLRHRSKDGAEIEVDVNQTQAVAIRETATKMPEDLALDRLPLPGGMKRKLAYATASLPVLADQLARLPHSSLPDPLIGIMVRILQEAGADYLVESLAAELETRGLGTLAAAVRAEARKEDGPTLHSHI